MNIFSSFKDHLVVVIVGVSGGIGHALAQRCLSESKVAKVYGLSRSSSGELVDESRYQWLPIDYADEASIEQAASKLPDAIDIVLVATGLLHTPQGDQAHAVQPEKTMRHIQTDKLYSNFLVNTIGPTLVAKHLLPKLRLDSKSVFGALSARVGSISDNHLGGWYAYRASKAALNMMVKTLAIEQGRRFKQAVVVGLHPGTVDTPLSKPFQYNVAKEKLFSPEYAAQCLLGVVNQLGPDDSGDCFAWDGQRIDA